MKFSQRFLTIPEIVHSKIPKNLQFCVYAVCSEIFFVVNVCNFGHTISRQAKHTVGIPKLTNIRYAACRFAWCWLLLLLKSIPTHDYAGDVYAGSCLIVNTDAKADGGFTEAGNSCHKHSNIAIKMKTRQIMATRASWEMLPNDHPTITEGDVHTQTCQ